MHINTQLIACHFLKTPILKILMYYKNTNVLLVILIYEFLQKLFRLNGKAFFKVSKMSPLFSALTAGHHIKKAECPMFHKTQQ